VRFVELIFILIFVGVGLINVIARLIMSNAKKKKRALSTEDQTVSSAVPVAETVEQPSSRGGGKIPEVEAVTRSGIMNVYEEGRKKVQEAIFREEAYPAEKKEPENASYMSKNERATEGPFIRRMKAPTVEEKPAPVKQEVKTSSGWQRINSLPPLKKAVILSEILGKPKGLER
jgi:hypothetical protein